MSYRITVKDNLLHLQYIGYVNGLQVMQVINDPGFLPNLKKVDRAIFDFSNTDEVDLSFEEVKSFGTLGMVESNFIESLHIIIILSSEAGRARAQHYVDATGTGKWKFDLVLTMQEAMQCFEK